MDILFEVLKHIRTLPYTPLVQVWLFQHSELQNDLKTMSLQSNYALFVSLSLQIINRVMKWKKMNKSTRN